jgi:hypothetical protein
MSLFVVVALVGIADAGEAHGSAVNHSLRKCINVQ